MMRPRPLSRSQPTRPGKIDKKQRLNKKTRTLKIDESVLKQSVKTCVNGLDKVIKVLENGTEEVVDYLSNECSIIYECRVCLSLFRSLANFIAHKRVYCRKKYTEVQKGYDEQIEEKMLSVSADFQRGILSSRTTSKSDIVNFLDALQLNKVTKKEASPDIFAVELEATKEALFHCFKHEGKHCSEERSATLGPDGRIIGTPKKLVNGTNNCEDENAVSLDRMPSPTIISPDDPSSSLPCPHCQKKFSSDRSLQSHIKASHTSAVRTCYSCPCCKKYLANTWSVYRHLSKVHKKSNEQIRKLRPQIHKKQVTDDEPSKSQPLTSNLALPPGGMKTGDEADKVSLGENPVLQGESHRCYVCGKSFERRVVMLAHAQICRDKGVTPSQADSSKKRDDSIEMISKRPRLDSPSPPPVPKSGIEVRMYYEKNKSNPANNSTTAPADTMHLKPTALALLASMPKARVVLTKTPVPAATSTRLSPCTPSPPLDNPTTSRDFSPRAEDIISRYQGRQTPLNGPIFERLGSLSPVNKVAVESVFCSDTEDSSSGCEYVLGAKDIAKCIGTLNSADDIQRAGFSCQTESLIGSCIDSDLCIPRRLDFKIKEEPMSDEEETRDAEEVTQNIVKHEIDSYDEEETAGIEEIFDHLVEDGGGLEEDDQRFENGQEDSSLLDVESSSSDSSEERRVVGNNEQEREEELEEEDEEEIDENEEECDEDDDGDDDDDDDDDDEEEEEDDDERVEEDSPFEDSHKVVTREESLIKEQAMNGLLKNGNHLSIKNGMNPTYAANWIFRKINSYIDGPKKKCLLCFKTFHRLNLVRRHVSIHLNIFNFKCMIDTCDFKCFLRGDMVKHLLKTHKKKEARRNRGLYMKRITEDMIPVDDNGVPCIPLSPVFPTKSGVSSLGKTSKNSSENIRYNDKMFGGFSERRTSSATEEGDSNRLSTSIDLDMDSEERAVNNHSEDEESTISGSESLKEFHTTNMQMYDTDLDELIINPDADSSDDKLRALMMQVIFGSGNIRRTSDQVSECGSDSVIQTTPPLSTTAMETASTDVGELPTQ